MPCFPSRAGLLPTPEEREFFIDNLLVRVHFIIVMTRLTGLAPWEFEFPFPGRLTSTFLPPDLLPDKLFISESGKRKLLHKWVLLVISKHLCGNICRQILKDNGLPRIKPAKP